MILDAWEKACHVIHRLLMQIDRILEINKLHTITEEVVETARENLVIGQA